MTTTGDYWVTGDTWTQARETAPFALLDATLALDSDGSWLRQALSPVGQRLRDAVETFAGEPTPDDSPGEDNSTRMVDDRVVNAVKTSIHGDNSNRETRHNERRLDSAQSLSDR